MCRKGAWTELTVEVTSVRDVRGAAHGFKGIRRRHFGCRAFLFALEGGQDFMPENTLRAYHYGNSANNREIPRIAGVKCCLPHFCAFLLRFS